MAKVRSPNYPNIPLGAALEAIRPAFRQENRNKMARSVLARHLGYTSLNGRALGKIGAVRAYGLIEGSGDELRISDDAVTALMAPVDSPQRRAALATMAVRPTLFQELRKDFPDTLPSLENLRFSLVQRGYTERAAEKAAQSFLASMQLATGVPGDYTPPEDEDETADGQDDPPPPPPRKDRTVRLMAGERELTSGLLSKDARFKLIVEGKIGVKEIERLIRKLELDKEILAEPDEDQPDSDEMLE
jgi:hypothetical protein